MRSLYGDNIMYTEPQSKVTVTLENANFKQTFVFEQVISLQTDVEYVERIELYLPTPNKFKNPDVELFTFAFKPLPSVDGSWYKLSTETKITE